MTKLTANDRNALPKSKFGLPSGTKSSGGSPAYPMPDASHAKNAKSRASQAVQAGNMSKADQSKINKKANVIIKRANRGK